MTRVLAVCCVLLFASARDAAAEWHFTPMLGWTILGNTSIVDLEGATDRRHRTYGGVVSLIGPGIIGGEIIGGWTQGFFERENLEPVDSSRVVTLMGNVLLTTPRRWTEYGLRPFFSGGLGLMQISKTQEVFPADLNLAGFNVGGGAIGFLSDRTGLRFDFRYYSVLNPSDHGTVAFGDVHMRYFTASIGLVLRR